jgi:hypothetical protein
MTATTAMATMTPLWTSVSAQQYRHSQQNSTHCHDDHKTTTEHITREDSTTTRQPLPRQSVVAHESGLNFLSYCHQDSEPCPPSILPEYAWSGAVFNDAFKAGPLSTQIRGRCLSEGGTIVEVLLQALKIQPTLPFGNRTCPKLSIIPRRSTE